MSNTPPPPPGQQPPPGGPGSPPPPPGYQQPAPPPGAYGTATPPGYQPYGQPTAGGSAQPADYGQRVIAYLIDIAIWIGIVIVAAIVSAVSDVLGLLVAIVGYIGYFIYNFLYLQGTTGQTLGKKQQGTKLVADNTGQPVGVGMTFVRYLVGGGLSTLTCGIYGIVDFLWPLWDPEKKRVTDKILKFAVVKA